MSVLRLALALLLVVVCLPAQKVWWPGFRGPGRDGVAPEANPPLTFGDEQNLVWKTALPGPGSSSPVVVGDQVFVTSYSGYGKYLDDGGDKSKLRHHVVAIDRSSGKIAWTREFPGALETDARQVQLNEHGFASPTPSSDGEALYVYLGRAGLVALSLDGKPRWQADLGFPSKDAPSPTNTVVRDGKALSLRWGPGASPLLVDDLVIVNCSEESNSLRAFDRRTGELKWKRETSNLEGAATSPVVVGEGEGRVVVMVLAGEVWGLAPKTGDLLWSVETKERGGMVPTPVTDGKLVYVFGGDETSYALRFQRELPKEAGPSGAQPVSRVVWMGKNVGIPSPVLSDGKLLLVRSNGQALCLDAKDGKATHEARLEGKTGSIYASPTLAKGRLYVVTRKRGTFVFSADGKFTPLAHNTLADQGQFNASPAMVGDRLFLRSDTHLYCFGETTEK